MSKYTVTLRQLLSSTDWHDRVEQAFKQYPLPRDEGGNRLSLLFDLFVATYDENEIGYETPALFVSELRNKSRVAVTKYGTKFYKRDDLYAMNYKTTNTVTDNGSHTIDKTATDTPDFTSSSSGSNSSHNENRAIEDDNPEKNISLSTEFSNNNYATKMNHSKGEGSASSSGTTRTQGTTKDLDEHTSDTYNHTRTETGSFKPIDELIKLLSIDSLELQFIDEYANLFMQVY